MFVFSDCVQIINAVVLLILLSSLAYPNQHHFPSSELGGDLEFMDDASKYHQVASVDVSVFSRAGNPASSSSYYKSQVLICGPI